MHKCIKNVRHIKTHRLFKIQLRCMVFNCMWCCHNSQKPLLSFVPTEEIFCNYDEFRQASNRCKRVLEAVILVYANKKRVYHFPQTLLTWLLVN